ncbi:MAG: DUF1493 family protein [Terracidiphilus sp.]|jgi:acyl carrier protein
MWHSVSRRLSTVTPRADIDAPSFEEIAEFVREWSQIPQDERIAPDTLLERDLGITGDDGSELLEAVEKRFEVAFSKKTFGLGPNEFLFNGEGIAPFQDLVLMLRRKPLPEVRSFTAGELYEAVRKALEEKSGKSA